ncbi:MAG: hypothetical protein IE909_15255 [Campylobacterales bacterium]|nr:hypothetical protein [Campylobacterales bacterium]
MLGAVIKFINFDNAKKEIAKHSEIVEEYVAISEQMKQDNEELTKNLSNVVRGQSESNRQVMQMISDDMRESSRLNIQFIQAIAQNKNEMMQQMNEVLQAVNRGTSPTIQQPTAQKEEPIIGFKLESNREEKIVKALFKNGEVKAGDKLVSKTQIINIKDRSEDKYYKQIMKKLTDNQVAKFKVGYGYYALGGLNEALGAL